MAFVPTIGIDQLKEVKQDRTKPCATIAAYIDNVMIFIPPEIAYCVRALAGIKQWLGHRLHTKGVALNLESHQPRCKETAAPGHGCGNWRVF